MLMRSISTSDLLNVWERGLTQHRVQQALTLLAAACPETSLQQLAELSIGQRDGLLLMLREWLFGSHLRSLATCPACGNRLEFTFNVADVRVTTANRSAETLSVNVASYQVQFRLPNSLDLEAVSSAELSDLAICQKTLLYRCLVTVQRDGEVQPAAQLPSEVLNAVVSQMAEADPQAEVQLSLTCPACEHQWQTIFDIVSFLWSEIHAWAVRLLREVHILALAYGWREADILALSSNRRKLYLEMVSQ